jgi:hypothetical protein
MLLVAFRSLRQVQPFLILRWCKISRYRKSRNNRVTEETGRTGRRNRVIANTRMRKLHRIQTAYYLSHQSRYSQLALTKQTLTAELTY